MDTDAAADPARAGLNLVTTRHGNEGLDALRRAVSEAKHDDALAPVTVLVPNNFVGLAARRALASGAHGAVVGTEAGVAGVSFSTLYRLAELLGSGSLAARGLRPVSTPVIAAAVRQVLRAAPGYFARVAEHPTTERRLVAAHRELSELDAPSLDTLAGESPRSADVVRVHRGVKQRLASSWYAEQDLIAAAIETLQAEPRRASQLHGDVVLFLPEDLAPSEAALVRALATCCRVTVVLGLTGAADADAATVRTASRLRLDPPAAQPAHLGDWTITSVSDADDEVRHAVRGIVGAARDGVAFDRMAVVYASDQPYLRLLHDHLASAGIPYNGSAVTTLAESMAGRLLRRLLSLPDRDFRREDVVALVSSSPLRWHGRTVPSRAWDQISRDAGVVKGASDWERRLEIHVADTRAVMERLGDDPEYEHRVRRLLRVANHTEQLRDFVGGLVTTLRRGAGLRGWAMRAAWCRELLRAHLAPDEGWPEAELHALERLHLVLDRLAGLDGVEPEADLAVFRRTLDLELEGGLGRVGSFGNGVLIGPARITVGLSLDRIWVLGLAEGSFPSRLREDSLLPDRERQHVADLRQRRDRTGDEHRHLLAALASVAPSGTAHLLVPRGDLRQSNERAPSRWLVDLAQQRVGHRLTGPDIVDLDAPWATHVPSFAAGVIGAAFPATVQEYELAAIVDRARDGQPLDDAFIDDDGPLDLPLAAQAARAASTFTRFDGNLGVIDIAPPGRPGRPTSATALETWARCPHQYLFRHLLGVDYLESPELRLRLDPLTRGTLVHDILDRFVDDRIEAGLAAGHWDREDAQRLWEIADEEFAAVEARGLTGEALYWQRDRTLLRRDLASFLERDRERRIDGRLRAVATEMGFGVGGTAPVQVELPDGVEITVRGSIDLVDETEAGGLVVVDYKTGAKTNIKPDAPHKNGQRLQLVLYALAARRRLDRPDAPVASYYWHLRAKDDYALVGYEVSPAIEEEVLGAVATIVRNIERGVFPQLPEVTTRSDWISCHYCDPDGLGTADARRRLVRMADDPRLTEMLELTEPDLLGPRALPGTGND